MRKIVSSLVLLWLCYVPAVAWCQATLALSEILSLQGKSPLQVDAYLVNRGWHMLASPLVKMDSTFAVSWEYKRSGQSLQAELTLFKKEGEEGKLFYATRARTIFDALKKQIVAYPMEPYTDDVAGDAIRRQFVGETYTVWTMFFHQKDDAATWYGFMVSQHGLTRLFTPDDNGYLRPVWVSRDGKILTKTLFDNK